MNSYVALGLAILAEIVATTALKASQGFTRLLPSLATVLFYGLAFYLLSLALRTIPVGVAYALWSAVGIVLISITSWLVFHQRLDLVTMAGIAFIIVGVLVINLGSTSHS
jgi:small multidrug resistance pump